MAAKAKALLKRALLQTTQGLTDADRNEAVRVFTMLIELLPNNPLFLSQRAEVYLVLDKQQLAIEDFQQAVHYAQTILQQPIGNLDVPQMTAVYTIRGLARSGPLLDTLKSYNQDTQNLLKDAPLA